MTDIEIIKKCAEKMGYFPQYDADGIYIEINDGVMQDYDPLTDDAQAMALLRKFNLNIGHTMPSPENKNGDWIVSSRNNANIYATGSDLNRAICECVARLP